jgi:Tfp pilus assembly protein PilW
MKLQSISACLGAKTAAGFTLVELMITVAISVFVIASIVTLAVISAQNYVATSNYTQMNDQSRNAMDRISREIRNASALISAIPNTSLVLTNANNNTTISITYNSSAHTLTLTTNQVTTATLTGCTMFRFELFQRQPDTNNVSYTQNAPDTGSCKVINLYWSCSRLIVGSKLSTDLVQTAQVMIRNQH